MGSPSHRKLAIILGMFLKKKNIDLKFIYSEKATKICEISTNYLTGMAVHNWWRFAKLCGLLRILI